MLFRSTGIAHFYEHMAFKGTRTVGTKDYEKEKPILDELALVGTELEHRQRELVAKSGGGTADEQATITSLQKRFTELEAQASQYVVGNELALLYQRHGGVGFNASTGKDLTRYTISLPANRLPLWAAIEADRMAHPVLREFYKERGVVIDEVTRAAEGDYESLVTLTVATSTQERSLSGTVFHDGKPRIVNIKGIKVDAEFAPSMVYVTNEDKPGFVGRFAGLLGDEIGRAHV